MPNTSPNNSWNFSREHGLLISASGKSFNVSMPELSLRIMGKSIAQHINGKREINEIEFAHFCEATETDKSALVCLHVNNSRGAACHFLVPAATLYAVDLLILDIPSHASMHRDTARLSMLLQHLDAAYISFDPQAGALDVLLLPAQEMLHKACNLLGIDYASLNAATPATK